MVRVRRAAKKGGGGRKEKGGAKKGGGAPHPPFFQKGVHAAQAPPPVYATEEYKIENSFEVPPATFNLTVHPSVTDRLYSG